jgi:hypothetical protein
VIRENFGAGIWTARVKRRFLVLRRRRAAEHLAARRLINSRFDSGFAHCFENAYRSQTRYIACIFRYLETDVNVTLRAEIIYFAGCKLYRILIR